MDEKKKDFRGLNILLEQQELKSQSEQCVENLQLFKSKLKQLREKLVSSYTFTYYSTMLFYSMALFLKRNPRLFGIVLDENFINVAKSEIKILEVKIQEIQKACTAAKKGNSSKQPIVKKVPVPKSVSVTIPANNPLHAESVTENTPLAVPKNKVGIK